MAKPRQGTGCWKAIPKPPKPSRLRKRRKTGLLTLRQPWFACQEKYPWCWYCGCSLDQTTRTTDHIVPKCQGGKNRPSNLAISCEPCNGRKGGRTPKEAGMSLDFHPWANLVV